MTFGRALIWSKNFCGGPVNTAQKLFVAFYLTQVECGSLSWTVLGVNDQKAYLNGQREETQLRLPHAE